VLFQVWKKSHPKQLQPKTAINIIKNRNKKQVIFASEKQFSAFDFI